MSTAFDESPIERFLSAVKPCPASGEGVHTWIFHAACCAVEAGLTNEEAVEEIEALMTRAPEPASEIEDALTSARGERTGRSPRWAPKDPMAIYRIAKQGPTLLELISRSPDPIQFGAPSRTEEVIDILFPGDPRLCIAKANE